MALAVISRQGPFNVAS